MTLPPLANLLAFTAADPGEVEALERRLRDEGRFAAVHRPHPRWVVASAPFAGGTPDAPPAEQHGLAFAEGRDRVERTPGLREAARLAASGGVQLGALPGDFTFVHVGDDGTATVVRSAGGLVPVQFERDGDRLLVTTRYADHLRYRRREPRLDPLVNAAWASGAGAFPDGRTFARDVRLLSRGHVLRVGPDRATSVSRWWDARPHEERDLVRGPENARELRAALVEALERELDPDAESLLTLSGGVDSSAVGALAAGTLGRRVVTASLLPVAEDTRARDLGYITSLAEQYPATMRLGPREVLTADLRLQLLVEHGVPFPVLQPIIGMLPRIVAREPARVVVGGEFADYTVGSTLSLYDWAAHTPARRLLTAPHRLPNGPRDLRFWAGFRARDVRGRPRIPFAGPADIPAVVRAEAREEYAEWWERRTRAAAEDRRPHRFLAMMLEREGFLGMHWELTSALGLRRAFPFVTRRALELALRTHPADTVGPGTKRLLRAAVRGDVPARHLDRPDKGRPGPGEDRTPRPWSGPVREDAFDVLDRGALDEKPMPFWSFLRAKQVVALLDAWDHARA